jgi:putative transposase
MMEDYDEVALLRYRMIAPLLDPDIKQGSRARIVKHISSQWVEHPNTKKQVQFQPETIRHWLKRYKKEGFSGLKSKIRKDKNSIKSMPEPIAQDAINLKLENPSRTIDGIISILEKSGKVPQGVVKRSTLHRLFQNRNINIRKLKPTSVFGRFEAQFPNDLWQSDLLFGPKLPDPKRPGKYFTAQLVAFIDDHSRLVPHAQFYHHGRLSHLEHCFRKSLQKRGIPKVVYVDNGAVYHSKQLLSICAHLGIQLKFTKPYQPEGKGKIEKFFSYVRSSFLVELETTPISDLDRLNHAFWAWLEVHYHRKIHHSTEDSPLKRFSTHVDKIRFASEDELHLAFLVKEQKKVHKDRTFQLKNRYYEVLPALVRQEITILYDPDNLEEVRVHLAGEFFQIATPIRLYSKVAPKGQLLLPTPVKTDYHHLKNLVREHQNQKKDAVLGPEIVPIPSDGRFTKRDFLELLRKHGFHLNAFEEKQITAFFKKYGPVKNPFAKKGLQLTIQRVGTEKHISFYLDLLKGDSHA